MWTLSQCLRAAPALAASHRIPSCGPIFPRGVGQIVTPQSTGVKFVSSLRDSLHFSDPDPRTDAPGSDKCRPPGAGWVAIQSA